MEKTINKQEERLIGKQLMIVNMIHVENEIDRNGGFSFVSPDQISEWSSLDVQKIYEILDSCASLDRCNFFMNVSKHLKNTELVPKENHVLDYTYYTLLRYGELFLQEFLCDCLESFCKKESEYSYKRYIEKYEKYIVSEIFGTPKVVNKIAIFFIKCFVETISSINKLFDWDVVREMLFEKMTWEEFCKIKTKVEDNTSEYVCREEYKKLNRHGITLIEKKR